MAEEVRDGQGEGKGGFLLVENPKKQNFCDLGSVGRLIQYLACARYSINAL